MTIAELCVVGKAAILVPYPFASEDHQAANALALIREHAVLMVRDADVAATLIDTILNLVKDEKKIGELQVNISKLSITNADEIIANEILKTIQKKILKK
jgi:UDP-N-acetylglucosamine--N-acetylmuramyl-(pentapeptide) pyrophosphoryl-undecaprenol N-acetylglucosamine transferase